MMIGTLEPVRWIDGGEGAPEGFDALVRADEAVESGADELSRVLDRMARQIFSAEQAAPGGYSAAEARYLWI